MEMSKAGFIYLLYFLSSVARAKKLTCGFPGTPAYGYVKPDSPAYSEGDVVSFSCRVGYILLGSPISRCTEDGSWSEDIPICDDSMTTLGVADATPTVPGHAAELAIDRDKETCTYLKPKKPRWWRIDLGFNTQGSHTQEHKVLSVAVTMMTIDKYVKFTVYVIKTQGTSASYKRCAFFSGKFGTPTVVLSCAEGKGIEGQTVHIEDHNPEEGFFEICEVEVQVEKVTGYDCGKPNRNLYSETFEPQNDLVEYRCIKGYELKGREFRDCLNSGQWSGEPPECIPIICDDLEPLENGETRLSHSNNGPPLEGALAIYKCNEGYQLGGSFTRNCLNDGSWSGKTPQCKAIRCPIPESKDLGGMYRLLNKTNSMGSMAMLRCREGKREGDNPYIICTEDGEWTQPQAHCIIPAKYVEPRIANRGALIFGMVVAAIMIVVVCVSIYLYGLKKRNVKPELPSRLSDPLVPPPRPPPRGAFLMGFMKQQPEEPGWRNLSPSRQTYSTVPEENEDVSLENVVIDVDGKESNRVSESSPIPPKDPAGLDYAAVDYEKKRQSRLLKDQDSVESSSSAGVSPIPTDEPPNKSPSPPKAVAATPIGGSEEEEESEEEASSVKEASEDDRKAEEERKAKEEEERKAKEEEERKAKEEEERKAKEEEERKAKEEEERKKAAEAPGRRRRIRDEPPAPEPEDKPVLRRFRRT